MDLPPRPSWIEIDLDALRHNIATVKSWAGDGVKLMVVVKADAYGHGAVQVSRVALQCGVDFLGVAFLEEACQLQDAGLNAPVVILYPETDQRSAEAVRRGFYITLSSEDRFRKIVGLLGDGHPPLKCFVSVETGMKRYGIPPSKAGEIYETLKSHSRVQFLGFTTNMADPVHNDSLLAQKQADSFRGVMELLGRHSDNGVYCSFESSALLGENSRPTGSLVRIGHLIYGLAPYSRKGDRLRPVMSVKSTIMEIHQAEKGDGVGYGFSYVAPRDIRVATVPLGYADGYPWSVSNSAAVLIHGRRAPVVGKICMDAFMVDVTEIPGCQVGDEVVILGRMGNETIDAHQLAEWAGSFSYEILARWSRRLPRIYK